MAEEVRLQELRPSITEWKELGGSQGDYPTQEEWGKWQKSPSRELGPAEEVIKVPGTRDQLNQDIADAAEEERKEWDRSRRQSSISGSKEFVTAKLKGIKEEQEKADWISKLRIEGLSSGYSEEDLDYLEGLTPREVREVIGRRDRLQDNKVALENEAKAQRAETEDTELQAALYQEWVAQGKPGISFRDWARDQGATLYGRFKAGLEKKIAGPAFMTPQERKEEAIIKALEAQTAKARGEAAGGKIQRAIGMLTPPIAKQERIKSLYLSGQGGGLLGPGSPNLRRLGFQGKGQDYYTDVRAGGMNQPPQPLLSGRTLIAPSPANIPAGGLMQLPSPQRMGPTQMKSWTQPSPIAQKQWAPPKATTAPRLAQGTDLTHLREGTAGATKIGQLATGGRTLTKGQVQQVQSTQVQPSGITYPEEAMPYALAAKEQPVSPWDGRIVEFWNTGTRKVVVGENVWVTQLDNGRHAFRGTDPETGKTNLYRIIGLQPPNPNKDYIIKRHN